MELLETLEGIITTLKNHDANDFIATESLTGKKNIFEAGQVLAKAGDYEKSQSGNKQAQRRIRKSMSIVAQIAKLVSSATKK